MTNLKLNLSIANCKFCFFVVEDVVAKYTREGKGHAEGGWDITHPVVSAICTEFSDALFEATVKSS